MSATPEATIRCACCLKPTDSNAQRFVLMHPWVEWRHHPVLLCKRCANDLPFRADDPILVPEGMENGVSVKPDRVTRNIYSGGAVKLIARNVLCIVTPNGDQQIGFCDPETA